MGGVVAMVEVEYSAVKKGAEFYQPSIVLDCYPSVSGRGIFLA